MNIKEIYREKKNIIFLYIFLLIVGVIIGGCIVLPSIFYDQWIWKYYWGPVVADVSGEVAVYKSIQAHEGYTIVSEITYSVIVVLALYIIYGLLKRLNIVVDWKFALALMPYILFGSVSKTLEDTGYFTEPLVYWFVSPLIFLQIAAYALFFLILGYYLEKTYRKPHVTVNTVMISGGLLFLLPSLYLTARWIAGDQWSDTTGVSFDVFLIVIGLVALIVGLIYLVARTYNSNEKLAVYKNPLNLAMLIGHLIDGLASYICIKDPFAMGLHYSEKHPASDVLLGVWGPLFPIVKFLLIIVNEYQVHLLAR